MVPLKHPILLALLKTQVDAAQPTAQQAAERSIHLRQHPTLQDGCKPWTSDPLSNKTKQLSRSLSLNGSVKDRGCKTNSGNERRRETLTGEALKSLHHSTGGEKQYDRPIEVYSTTQSVGRGQGQWMFNTSSNSQVAKNNGSMHNSWIANSVEIKSQDAQSGNPGCTLMLPGHMPNTTQNKQVLYYHIPVTLEQRLPSPAHGCMNPDRRNVTYGVTNNTLQPRCNTSVGNELCYGMREAQSRTQVANEVSHEALQSDRGQQQYFVAVLKDANETLFRAANVIFVGNQTGTETQTTMRVPLGGSKSGSGRQAFQMESGPRLSSTLPPETPRPHPGVCETYWQSTHTLSGGGALQKAVAIVPPLSQPTSAPAEPSKKRDEMHVEGPSKEFNEQYVTHRFDNQANVPPMLHTRTNQSITVLANGPTQIGIVPEVNQAGESLQNRTALWDDARNLGRNGQSSRLSEPVQPTPPYNMDSARESTQTADVESEASAEINITQENFIGPGKERDITIDAGDPSSKITTVQWNLEKLQQLVRTYEKAVKLDNNSLPTINAISEILRLYWDGDHAKICSAVRSRCYHNIMDEVFAYQNYFKDEKSVIFQQIKKKDWSKVAERCCVLKPNEVVPLPEVVHSSSWLNLNEKLDDIDNGHVFSKSSKFFHSTLKAEEQTQRTRVETGVLSSSFAKSQSETKHELTQHEIPSPSKMEGSCSKKTSLSHATQNREAETYEMEVEKKKTSRCSSNSAPPLLSAVTTRVTPSPAKNEEHHKSETSSSAPERSPAVTTPANDNTAVEINCTEPFSNVVIGILSPEKAHKLFYCDSENIEEEIFRPYSNKAEEHLKVELLSQIQIENVQTVPEMVSSEHMGRKVGDWELEDYCCLGQWISVVSGHVDQSCCTCEGIKNQDPNSDAVSAGAAGKGNMEEKLHYVDDEHEVNLASVSHTNTYNTEESDCAGTRIQSKSPTAAYVKDGTSITEVELDDNFSNLVTEMSQNRSTCYMPVMDVDANRGGATPRGNRLRSHLTKHKISLLKSHSLALKAKKTLPCKQQLRGACDSPKQRPKKRGKTQDCEPTPKDNAAKKPKAKCSISQLSLGCFDDANVNEKTSQMSLNDNKDQNERQGTTTPDMERESCTVSLALYGSFSQRKNGSTRTTKTTRYTDRKVSRSYSKEKAPSPPATVHIIVNPGQKECPKSNMCKDRTAKQRIFNIWKSSFVPHKSGIKKSMESLKLRLTEESDCGKPDSGTFGEMRGQASSVPSDPWKSRKSRGKTLPNTNCKDVAKSDLGCKTSPTSANETFKSTGGSKRAKLIMSSKTAMKNQIKWPTKPLTGAISTAQKSRYDLGNPAMVPLQSEIELEFKVLPTSFSLTEPKSNLETEMHTNSDTENSLENSCPADGKMEYVRSTIPSTEGAWSVKARSETRLASTSNAMVPASAQTFQEFKRRYRDVVMPRRLK